MSVHASPRRVVAVVRLLVVSSVVLIASIAQSAVSPTSRAMRTYGVRDVVDPTAVTTRRVEPSKAARNSDSKDAHWLEFQEVRMVGNEQPLAGGLARSRSAASADLNWDGHPDLVVGSASGDGGHVAIHLASPEAFGPQRVDTLQGIAAGRFPESFLPDAAVYAVPEAADFVAVGDFDRDGRVDLLTARRGGTSLYLLSNNGRNGFEDAQAIAMPGSVTALVAGRFNTADDAQDLAVAVAGPAGPRVLVFATARGLTEEEPLAYPVPSEATVLVAAELDESPSMDLAVLTGDEVLIVHGAGEQPRQQGPAALARSRVERVRGAEDVLSLAVGDFMPDRGSRNELAVLSIHGEVSFLGRGTLDTRPMTEEDIVAGRQRFAEAREREEYGASDAAQWKPGDSEPWSELRRVTVSSALLDRVPSRPLIMGANVAAQPGEELLVLDPTSDQLQIVSVGSDWQTEEAGDALRTVALDAGGAPIAVLPMRLGVLAQPGLIVLSEGHSAARAILPKVAATFTVTKTADTNDGACNADCSLREAIVAANASAGADMITFAAALNGSGIQLTRAGDDNTAANGDLDINDDITILGNGATNTLIQGSSNASFAGNMGDKVFGINQDGTHADLNVSISNLTVRFTRNDIAPHAGFTQTGGAMDIFLTGTGAVPGPTTALSNCTFDSNASALSYGGAINIDSGSLSPPLTNIYRGTVQITGCTISSNRTLNATPTSDPPSGGGVNLFSDRHDVTFSSCSFMGNQTAAHIAGNGGGLNIRHSFGGTITLTSCSVVNNSSGSDGGGILIAGLGGETVNMTGGSITGNVAQGTGDSAAAGGIFNANPVGSTTLSGVTISNNAATAGPGGVGGGIVDGSNSPMSITNCTVTGNSSDSGGGIATINAFASQLTTITGCTITGNTAGTGGGLFVSSGSMNASLCRIVGNTAASGSGIALTGGTALVENNWWGCDGFPNAAGCQTGSGAFDADPRLDLKLTAGSTALGFSASTTLTASFATNSNNQAVNPVVMNGLTVTFATPAGSVSPATPILASLQATTTFTAPASCPVTNPVLPSATIDSGTQTVGITIQQPPGPITCPANITVSNTPGMCGAAVTFTTPTATGCPVPTVTCVPASGSTFSIGTTTVTCTASNGVLPDTTCSFTVTVNDTQAPTVACPANITQPNTAGQCSGVATFATPAASDNCPGATVVCVPASGSTFPIGTTTVTCTATDASANTGSCSFTMTIQDTQAPTVACPANITTTNAPGQCSAVVSYTTPAGADNCPGVTVVCAPASGSTFPVGVTTVTCTATDASPDSPDGTCSFTVTIQDTQAPTVTCPANITTGNTPGQCSAVVNFTTPTAVDNCPGATVACEPPSGSTFPSGTTTVICTASDTSANSPDATCSFTVTVQDTQAPTVTCPANITLPNAPGQCSRLVTYTTPTGTDNCPGVVTVVCVPASGSTFPVGTTSVTCTASDGSANSPDGTCSFTVTIQDTQAPTVACPANITTPAAAGQCSAVVNFTTPTPVDNCPGPFAVVCFPASGSTFAVGTTVVTCLAMDLAGNQGGCTFLVTVNDTQAPTVTCPANITVVESPPSSGSATVTYTVPTASDNCPGATVNCVPASGSSFPVGVTTVTCTATDASANTGTCTFTVTVQPACTITCPANVTTANDANQCGAVVNYPAPSTTGVCGTVTCVPASGSFFAVGTTTVNCSTTSGPTCSFTVTVNDTQAPVANCPVPITVPNAAGQCSAAVTFASSASDNCPGASIACVPASGSTFPVGTTTVTCTATDAVGNTGTCSFGVTVQDTEAPAITCPANMTVPKTPGQCSTAVSYTVPTPTDNCPGATASCTPASGSTFPVGVTTVTCTATDASPNSPDTTCTFTITVTDTTAPVITCPANVTVPNDANVCGATVKFADPATSDNCPGTTVVCVPATGSLFAIGTTTVTCTATDASNNTSTCSFTVTVQDTQAPVATCPAPITAAAATGTCAAVVNYTATATDNCPGVGIVCAPASGSAFPVGVTTVSCTATDATGNTGTCAFTVTVQDTQLPAITCPANITVTTDTTSGCTFTAVVNYPAPVATDNCGLASVVCVPPSGSTFNEGTTTVTCTATDTSGNTAACTFTVTVGAAFGYCSVDDATGNRFQMVVDPASPSYGVWRFTVVATNTRYCGKANFINYVPGIRLRAYDNDYSAENPTFFMDANFKTTAGTVTVRNVSGTIRLTLRDRNLLDSVCP